MTFKTERTGCWGRKTNIASDPSVCWQLCQIIFFPPLSFNTTRMINPALKGGDMRSCPSALVLSVSAASTPDVGMLHLCVSAGVHSLVCVYSGQLLSSGRWDDLGRTSRSPPSSVARRCDLVNTDSTGISKCCTAPKVRFLALCYTPSAFWGTFSQRMICS